MGFWSWHKKMWNSTEPIMGFRYEDDGEGNTDFKMFIGGSKLRYQQIEDKKEKELIECDTELLE